MLSFVFDNFIIGNYDQYSIFIISHFPTQQYNTTRCYIQILHSMDILYTTP